MSKRTLITKESNTAPEIKTAVNMAQNMDIDSLSDDSKLDVNVDNQVVVENKIIDEVVPDSLNMSQNTLVLKKI